MGNHKPQGRGRQLGRVKANAALTACARDRGSGSLSPGERAGVRGNRASTNMQFPIQCNALLSISVAIQKLGAVDQRPRDVHPVLAPFRCALGLPGLP